MLDYPSYQEAMRRNAYQQDFLLRALLDRQLDPDMRRWAEPLLDAMGEQAAGPLAELAVTANTRPPALCTHNAWGERVDRVEMHPAYDRLARAAYEGGVVWPRFNKVLGDRHAPWSVVFSLGYLFGQAEQGLFCPICLTAGSAWVVERFADPAMKATYLPRLAARKYEDLWEGAMFLTERAGGSDVGAAETVARQEDGGWRLYGDKWFCSNGGRAEVMLVLARPAGAPAGTRGLGLFLVPLTLPDGTRNRIRFNRLKDKLGTRSMPSAELTFEGATAQVVGQVERGFAQMAEMLNISRIYNAIGSVSNMRRMVREAAAYTAARKAFGRAVADYPMVQDQLARLASLQEADTMLAFETIRYLDDLEAGRGGEHTARLLRILTPLAKYHTARHAVDTASAVAELFGGNGYIEDWPPPRFLRDAQVLPIWEGTTNILVLDVLRAIEREDAAGALLEELDNRLASPVHPALSDRQDAMRARLSDLKAHFQALTALADATIHAKEWCDAAVTLFQGLLLLEEAGRQAAQGQGRGLLALSCFSAGHLERQDWRIRLGANPGPAAYPALIRGQAVPLAQAAAHDQVAAGTTA